MPAGRANSVGGEHSRSTMLLVELVPVLLNTPFKAACTGSTPDTDSALSWWKSTQQANEWNSRYH